MQRSLISLAVMALLGLSAGAPTLAVAAPAAKAAQVTTQLPRTAVPTHYAVSLTPDAANSTFSASVTIALDVKQSTSSLTLQATDLKFSAAAISAGPAKPAQAASKIAVDESNQTATFQFAQVLKPGSYQLKLDYTGVIGTQPAGMFALDYENGILVEDELGQLQGLVAQEQQYIFQNTTKVSHFSAIEMMRDYPEPVQKLLAKIKGVGVDMVLKRLI